MHASEGILTARGGMTSHAAVVARGMGTCCVAGCGEVVIDEASKTMTLRTARVLTEGEEFPSTAPPAMSMPNRLRPSKPR